MKKLVFTIFLAAIACAHVAAQSPTPTPAKVDASEASARARRLKTFQKAWEIVQESFYDPNFNGVDWNDVRLRYISRASAARTDAEFYELLNRMLSELKVSHMQVVTPEELKRAGAPPVTTGISLRTIEGRVVVTRVIAGSSAESAGVRTGFAVTKVDGAEVKDLKDAQARLRGAPGTKVTVSFLGADDVPREAVLERLSIKPVDVVSSKLRSVPFYALFESRRLEGGVGYIRFTSFIPALDVKIEEALASMRDAPGVVIDLRGNGGGNDSVAINLANQLFDKPTQLMVTRTRKGDDLYYRAKPTKSPYLGPIVMLVDALSGSASEQLTTGLQEVGRAYVVGNKTAGDDMDADMEELPDGSYLIYAYGLPRTPKGVVVEGRGVIPDLEVNLTRAGLLRGEDAQLDAAVNYIKGRTATKGNN